MSQNANITRLYREKLLADPYRPGYHFAVPDGNGYPGDPNGAFFADGRYHLMYLYKSDIQNSYSWGHISSLDLLHWRHHPDALTSLDGDGGCFSGGAFVDDDGTAYLTFWKFPSKNGTDNGGIAIAYSKSPYEVWERITPIAVESSHEHWGVTDIEIDGHVKHIACADPGNIWKMNGYYYIQTGNKVLLDNFGRNAGSPIEYKGDFTDLFRSKDLKSWEFVHRFYENPHLDADYPDETEDDMCPTLLPLPDAKCDGKLTEKYLQTFISHNKGGQYYIGELRGEKFHPTEHGRFTWKDNALFAPEAMLDDKNRHLAWFWYLDDIKGEYAAREWLGVYSFPRVFWYDGGLKMAPACELDKLQYNEQSFNVGSLDGTRELAVKNGESFRLRANIDPCGAKSITVRVRANSDCSEYTDITVDIPADKLIVDTTHSGNTVKAIREEAPFTLTEGETLSLDIFVDKSVVEVYANERQAICRRVYPATPSDAMHVHVISDGADLGEVAAWEMMPTNMY